MGGRSPPGEESRGLSDGAFGDVAVLPRALRRAEKIIAMNQNFVLESDSEVVINDLMTPSHFHLKSVLGRRPLKFSLVLEG